MGRRIVAGVVVTVLMAGCGGHEGGTTAPHSPTILGPGRLVPIGGGRALYARCEGAGRPSVVLEAGLGGDTFAWRGVQSQIARLTRACAYDRAGFGNSVARRGVDDAAEELADLQRLLQHARIRPPYVLVGHSYGGLLARLFARAHAREVAGIVLVDAVGRDQMRRTLAVWPRSQLPALRRAFARPINDGVDLAAGEALAAQVRTLGRMRLVVVTAGRHDAEWGGLSPRPRRAFDRLWTTMQDELAGLSSDHVHVVALRSDHMVQGPEGQPDVVVRAVDAVVRAARDGTRLPPCVQLFSGRDVRCRP